MPELPEVESFKKYIDDTSLHQKIKTAKLSDESQLDGIKGENLLNALKGNIFLSTFRHGKYLFIEMQNEGYLMLHFGMTGDLLYYVQDSKKPRYFVLLFEFENGYNLLFSDIRKIGKISLVKTPEDFIREKKLGQDAMLISEKEFVRLFKTKKGAIKSVLMDQHVVAGVGNEFSDEMLFQVRLHPQSNPGKVTDEKLSELYFIMRRILSEAVSKNADRSKLKNYFFLGNRRAGLKCPECEGHTEMKTIGGRSAYFCPSCQELIR